MVSEHIADLVTFFLPVREPFARTDVEPILKSDRSSLFISVMLALDIANREPVDEPERKPFAQPDAGGPGAADGLVRGDRHRRR